MNHRFEVASVFAMGASIANPEAESVSQVANFSIDEMFALCKLVNMTHPLKAYREVNNLTLDDLRQKTGLSRSFLSQVETGARRPGVDAISRICAATKLGPADFISVPSTVDADDNHVCTAEASSSQEGA